METNTFKKLEPFKMLPTNSSSGQLEQTEKSTCSVALASRGAAMLLGCYRKGDAADPETYVTAIAAVLSLYPVDVVQAVSDPRTGIAGRSNWLPTVAEVKAECERLSDPSPSRRWQQVEAETLARRKTPMEPFR